ncbi:SseB family protein [Hamadaea tsunoensis]|uniref:SseB family protein n=1 Tax=Hamadaea tsunoensis TaxID=53368 RepID=UPI000410546E
MELVLPVSPDAAGGGASPSGWGTWTTDHRTHVLAFTSPQAMQACLAQNAGSARRIPYLRLAEQWPNHEWWLAVNPGLPIEGYLPSWFVAQLAAQARNNALRAQAPPVPPVAPPAPAVPAPPMAPTTPIPPANGRNPRSRAERLEALTRAQAGVEAPQRPAQPAERPDPARYTGAQRGEHYQAYAQSQAAPSRPAYGGTAPADTRRDQRPPAAEPANGRTAARDGQPLLELESAARPAGGRHADSFTPANEVERQLFEAAEFGDTDNFLSTLLLAQVLVPVPPSARSVLRPADSNFGWQTQIIDGQPYVVVYTSADRAGGQAGQCVRVRFIQLISAWPDETWSFAVNPGTPVGATLPGDQVVMLANWAGRMGLSSEETSEIRSSVPAVSPKAAPPTVMQKPISPSQIGFYLERGYDRVSGFVHRAHEVGQLKTPDQLRTALGLTWDGTPFEEDADEIYILRWSAYRPSLYRIPYGGQNEQAMKAMEGWVIERPPFRGNGFAPGESSTVIAEFKVDSARLPHGARLLRLGADGVEEIVAVLDADGPRWLKVGKYPQSSAETPPAGEEQQPVAEDVDGTVEGEVIEEG